MACVVGGGGGAAVANWDDEEDDACRIIGGTDNAAPANSEGLNRLVLFCITGLLSVAPNAELHISKLGHKLIPNDSTSGNTTSNTTEVIPDSRASLKRGSSSSVPSPSPTIKRATGNK